MSTTTWKVLAGALVCVALCAFVIYSLWRRVENGHFWACIGGSSCAAVVSWGAAPWIAWPALAVSVALFVLALRALRR